MGDDQSHTGSGEPKGSASQAPEIVEDNWSHLTDPEERRRVQNRNAQRRFREKAKLRKDEEEKKRQEDQQAAFAYEPPRPEQLGARDNVSGLPWGSFPFAQAVEAGRAKEEEQRRESMKEPSRAASDTPAYHQPPEEDPKQ